MEKQCDSELRSRCQNHLWEVISSACFAILEMRPSHRKRQLHLSRDKLNFVVLDAQVLTLGVGTKNFWTFIAAALRHVGSGCMLLYGGVMSLVSSTVSCRSCGWMIRLVNSIGTLGWVLGVSTALKCDPVFMCFLSMHRQYTLWELLSRLYPTMLCVHLFSRDKFIKTLVYNWQNNNWI